MKQRILAIGKRFYTNKDALAERFGRVYRLPAAWSQAGRDVRLWLVDYHTGEAFERREGRLDVASTPVFSMASLRALWRGWRFRPEVVVAAGDCYLGLLGWMLARLCGAAFVFDVYDKYDEFAGYRRPLGLDLFGFLRRRADLRWYCSRGLQASHAEASASAYIANGVDDAEFRPLDMARCRSRLGLPEGPAIIGYFGSMEPDRGVADLVEAVDLVRAGGTDLRLLICGRADPALPLQEDWIAFRGMVPHADMPCYLGACDLLAVPYRESAIMDMGASCKLAEYLLCGRPLVSTRTRNFTANFPRQADELGELLAPPSNPAALAAAIGRQLEARLQVTPPTELGWSTIAAEALTSMERLGRG